MDQAALYSALAKNRYGVVSSIANGATPQSALVGIAVTSELEIIFDTLVSSRKYQNLIARPQCSFVIGLAGEQTVQFEGEAFEPRGADLTRYREAYFAVWPDGRARLNWPGIVHLVVRPRWIRFCDYEQDPPFIEEFRFGSGTTDPR